MTFSLARKLGAETSRLLEWLAPEDRFSAAAWPTTFLLRPLPMLALVLMVANDHWAKHAGLFPGWATGKLSDFAGLFFFPFLLLTLLNFIGVGLRLMVPAAARLASPSLGQLAACIGITAFGFSALQLSTFAANVYVFYVGRLLHSPVRVTQDWTDLVALLVLFGTWRQGQQMLGRMPPGRIALLRLHLAPNMTREMRVQVAENILCDVVNQQSAEHQWDWKRFIEDIADMRDEQILDEQLAWLRRDC